MTQFARTRRTWTLVVGLVLACGLTVGVSACGGGGSSSSGSSGGSATSEGSTGSEKYTVYLDINGTFNQFRTQMKNIAEYAAANPPLGEKLDFHWVTSPEDLAGQTTDVNNIIAKHPDALILNAASSTGLNAEVERACEEGILVVSFDGTVTADCAYKVTRPLEESMDLVATYLGEQIGGKGEVVIDKGLVGNTVADESYAGYVKGFEKYPGISVAGTVESGFNPGELKSQLAPILAAHPDVKAIVSVVIIKPAIQALEAAGLEPQEQGSATISNEDTAECRRVKVKCVVAPVPPYISAEAMKLTVELLEGKADKEEKTVVVEPPYIFTEAPPKSVPGFTGAKFEEAQPVPNVSGELTLPVAPEWLNITPQQAFSGA